MAGTQSTGRKKSNFPAQTSVLSGASFDYFVSGVNYKITFENFLTALNVTGTIVQVGPVTGVPVLDTQGTVHGIRNLTAGPGVNVAIDPENGITLSAGSAATDLTEGQVPKADSIGNLTYGGATVDPSTLQWTFDNAINYPRVIVETATSYTQLLPDDIIIASATSTVTLVAVASATKTITIKSLMSGGIVTVDGNGSETIEGLTTHALSPGTSITIAPTSSEWVII